MLLSGESERIPRFPRIPDTFFPELVKAGAKFNLVYVDFDPIHVLGPFIAAV